MPIKNNITGCNVMKKSYAQKIQALLIAHLLNQGQIELLLPDGVRLEIGITKDGKHGPEISDNYCYVKSSRQDKSSAMLDTYNLVLEYNDSDSKKLICIDNTTDAEGQALKRLEIV